MQKLQLSIPEPCHENWHNMAPTDQGRFCNTCAKEVVDFSMMTDTEILNYFTTLTNEKVCGRALPSQLDRTITWPKETKKRLFWYWNYIVMFFMFFAKPSVSKAQGNVQCVTEAQLNSIKAININNALTCKVGEPVKIGSRVINGKVTDIDGNPVSFATILLKNSKVGVSADAEGKYSIKVNSKSDTLEISAAGFERKIINLAKLSAYDFVLSRSSNVELGGLVVVSYYGKKRKMSMGGLVVISDSAVKVNPLKSVINKVSNFVKKDSIRVYPNPVQRGNAFNISLKLKQTGNYNIQITDASGRIVLQKQTNIPTKDYIEKLQTENRWGSGLYYIRVFDTNNKPISKTNFIVQ